MIANCTMNFCVPETVGVWLQPTGSCDKFRAVGSYVFCITLNASGYHNVSGYYQAIGYHMVSGYHKVIVYYEASGYHKFSDYNEASGYRKACRPLS